MKVSRAHTHTHTRARTHAVTLQVGKLKLEVAQLAAKVELAEMQRVEADKGERFLDMSHTPTQPPAQVLPRSSNDSLVRLFIQSVESRKRR